MYKGGEGSATPRRRKRPAGPRGPVGGGSPTPSRHSGGTSGDLSIPDYVPQTPVVGTPNYSNLHFTPSGLAVTPGGGGGGGGRSAAAQALNQHQQLQSILGPISNIVGIELTPHDARAIAQVSNEEGVDPGLLTSIYSIESGFGTNEGPSSAGAIGKMQFMPETWESYGEGGDPSNIYDAVRAAARYLKASGYKQGDPEAEANAVYSYNHSQDYVNEVLGRANQFRPLWDQAGTHTFASQPLHSPAYTYPFQHSQNLYVSRTDMGKDFSGEGPISAIGKAKIISTGAPGWPEEGGVLYKLLKGPAKGRHIFTYEGVDPTVEPGEVVKKGETIANFRPGGSIETGFATPTGEALAAPYYNEGEETTPGKKMSAWLERLSGKPSTPEFGSSVPTSYAGGSYAPSTAGTGTNEGIMNAALGTTAPASPASGNSLADILKYLESPVPTVEEPTKPLTDPQDLLRLALRRGRL